MFAQKITLQIKALTPDEARQKANLATTLCNNLDLEALTILSNASKSPTAQKKLKDFRGILENL